MLPAAHRDIGQSPQKEIVRSRRPHFGCGLEKRREYETTEGPVRTVRVWVKLHQEV